MGLVESLLGTIWSQNLKYNYNMTSITKASHKGLFFLFPQATLVQFCTVIAEIILMSTITV